MREVTRNNLATLNAGNVGQRWRAQLGDVCMHSVCWSHCGDVQKPELGERGLNLRLFRDKQLFFKTEKKKKKLPRKAYRYCHSIQNSMISVFMLEH